MVCLGNICRSPTAEGVLRAKLEKAGLQRRVRVESAGTNSLRGSPPDPRAVAAAAKRGYALDKIRARDLADDDFERFEWILAMDDSNLAALQQRCPQARRDRLRLFTELLLVEQGPPPEVPDPYYGAPEGFERVLDLIEPACDAWVARLQESLATQS
ncbi:MAG: low molecular weight phosphotyrosine protein phosphatase [Burkholderiales bacterium]|nr:low molecular weight phosphotyrosine protein phosphatase [Burkholderiales bacterium]